MISFHFADGSTDTCFAAVFSGGPADGLVNSLQADVGQVKFTSPADGLDCEVYRRTDRTDAAGRRVYEYAGRERGQFGPG